MVPGFTPSAYEPPKVAATLNSVIEFVNESNGVAMLADERGGSSQHQSSELARLLAELHNPEAQAAVVACGPLIGHFVGTELDVARPPGEALGRNSPADPMRMAVALDGRGARAGDAIAHRVEGIVVAGFLAAAALDRLLGNPAEWRDVQTNRAWQNFVYALGVTAEHVDHQTEQRDQVWQALYGGPAVMLLATFQDAGVYAGWLPDKRRERVRLSARYLATAGRALWHVVTTDIERSSANYFDAPLMDACRIVDDGEFVLAAHAVSIGE